MKHLIYLWSGYLVEKLSEINEETEERNGLQNAKGKRRLVQNVLNNEFCKFIGCNLSAATFRNKRHKLWDVNSSREILNGIFIISRDVIGNTYLLKVSCPIYNLNYSFLHQ